MQVRYPLSALAEILGLLIALLAAMTGMDVYPGRVVSPGIHRGVSLVGFVALFAALVGLQGPSRVVRDEADLGTLEQLCMGRFSLHEIIITRVLADTLRLIPILLFVLILAARISGTPVFVPLHQVSVMFLLTGVGMLGWGLMVASLVLLVKRMGFLTNLISLAMLPLVFLPAESLPGPVAILASTIPFRWSMMIFQRIARGRLLGPGVTGTGEIIWLVGTSLVSTAAGILVFKAADRSARMRGLLGKY
ncbi:MAG TPA: ABC transporter permease [Firmicutes bacterium]|nr:ABC transporter permease [Bacillota bacterium]